MKTTNIVSTPNITGNIGSCTTQAQKVVVQSGIWADDGYTITTNSCTGAVERFNYHSINGLAMVGGFVLGALLFILIGGAMLSRADHF